jgi:hypothetical protein
MIDERSAPTPTADPLPWLTSVMSARGVFITMTTWEQYGDWEYDEDEGIWRRPKRQITRLTGVAAAALLEVLTDAVSALHDDDKTYAVVLNAKNASASTTLERRLVEVGTKPLHDETLTHGQRAAVLGALALHEVGHIVFSREYAAAITRLFGRENVTGAIRGLSNLAADLHDEAAIVSKFPGLGEAIPVLNWWLGGGVNTTTAPATEVLVRSAADRVNLAIAACMYPWTVDWDSAEAVEWLDWWTDWAKRARAAGQPKVHAEVVKEAIEKVREANAPTSRPEGPKKGPDGGCGPEGPGGKHLEGDPKYDDENKPKGDQPGGDGEPKGDDEEPKGDQPGGQNGGKGDEPKGDEPKGDEPTQPGGSAGGDGEGYDPDENKPVKDSCPKSAARDPQVDSALQEAADKVTRGKREGMRRRTYDHTSSHYHAYGGRTVVSIPRKGNRWVSDI